jgi:hypothetical protein
MEPPKNTEIIEWETSTIWFDENGILCSISKKARAQSLEEIKENLETFKKLIGEKKICMLLDVTHSAESTKEARDYAAIEFPKFVKAIAMVSSSVLGKMLANLFFSIKAQPYPAKMFNDEKEAKEWLKHYL